MGRHFVVSGHCRKRVQATSSTSQSLPRRRCGDMNRLVAIVSSEANFGLKGSKENEGKNSEKLTGVTQERQK
jgi:hypothetical protein